MGCGIYRWERGERWEIEVGIRETCMETGGNAIPDVSMISHMHIAAYENDNNHNSLSPELPELKRERDVAVTRTKVSQLWRHAGGTRRRVWTPSSRASTVTCVYVSAVTPPNQTLISVAFHFNFFRRLLVSFPTSVFKKENIEKFSKASEFIIIILFIPNE